MDRRRRMTLQTNVYLIEQMFNLSTGLVIVASATCQLIDYNPNH